MRKTGLAIVAIMYTDSESALAFSCFLSVSSCQVSTAVRLQAAPNVERDSSKVRVFYATNRRLEGVAEGINKYNSSRNQQVTYGLAIVNVPQLHKIGVQEKAGALKYGSENDTAKYMSIVKTRSMRERVLFRTVDSVAYQGNSGVDAILFVHGYNVSFQGATLNTAQLKRDLGFTGPVFLFSWPSKDNLRSYVADEDAILWATSDIERFIQSILNDRNIRRLHIVAHSMGNRGVTQALISLAQSSPKLMQRIGEVVLAAPDISADYFVRDVAPKLTAFGQRITLYVSSNDKPLMASMHLHDSPARAGDSGESIVIAPGIETIDASNVDTGLIGHSYILEKRELLTDLYQLIHTGKGAADRFGLERIQLNNKAYWLFKK